METLLRCSLCNRDFSTESPVGKTGLVNLVKTAQEKGNLELYNTFVENLNQEPVGNVYVHHDCRRKYVDKRKHKESGEQCNKTLISSSQGSFSWKLDCFLCEKQAKDGKGRMHSSVSQVSTLPIRDTLIERCKERNDE